MDCSPLHRRVRWLASGLGRGGRGRLGGVSHAGSGEAGFSLVEMLAVVFIVGLMAGTAVMMWPSSRAPARDEAERFAMLMQRAQQHAVIAGAPVGVLVTGDGVEVLQRFRQEWRALPLGRAGGGSWEWPDSVGAVLVDPQPSVGESDGRRLRNRDDVERTDVQSRPQLVCDPTGGMTPFVLVFSGLDGDYTVGGNYAGQVVVVKGGSNALVFDDAP